ncbi:MAG: hypothetical protein AAF943_18705, partial [Pseudomonadota bacterium]
MTKPMTFPLTAAALSLMALPALSDTVTGNLTVRDVLCVGSSCANDTIGEFGFNDFEDIRLKSINTWLRFEDTSNNAGLPTNDWMLRVNDLGSGGEDYIAFEDIDASTVPFRVDAAAPTDALRVTASGNIGIGTGMPAALMHMRSGDTPTLMLEQDGSGTFSPYLWELAGNENFLFFRGRTSLSAPFPVIPFKIFPGGSDTVDAFVISGNGDIGLGTDAPEAALHVAGTSMLIKDKGRVNFTLSDTSDPGPDFRTQLTAGTARFSFVGTGAPEMELFQSGDLAIRGRYISAGTTLTVPDYV